MKPDEYLLNFSRGQLVVDEDLVQAVNDGVIAGAVLDVFRTQPMPQDHPFWTTDGITVLPHIGGLHPQRDELVAELLVDNLRKFLSGETLRAVVDRERGY
jgi:phosphoglycerate dehydrogenase-like enzyme